MRINEIKTTWYTQDFVDPLLFNNTGEEIAIPKEAIKGIVNNIRVTFEETLEIDEDDYYLLLALLNVSADNTSPNEAERQLVKEVAGGKKTGTIQFARRLVDQNGGERRDQTMCFYFISMC